MLDKLPAMLKGVEPYIRLARLKSPMPIILLMAPCFFVIAASPIQDNALLIIKVIIGAFLSRSFGCIINDLIDADIDKKVERTKNRPIASGEISVKKAMYVLLVLCACGFSLLITMKPITVFVGILLFAMIAVYPMVKRFLPIPQIFLGILFAGGALVCGAELYGVVDMSTLLIYIGCVLWIAAYDTIYAMQDAKYDKILGVNSSVIFFKDPYKAILKCYNATALFWLFSVTLFSQFRVNVVPFTILVLISWGILFLQNKYARNNKEKISDSVAFLPNVVVSAIMTVAFWLTPVPKLYHPPSNNTESPTSALKNNATEQSIVDVLMKNATNDEVSEKIFAQTTIADPNYSLLNEFLRNIIEKESLDQPTDLNDVINAKP